MDKVYWNPPEIKFVTIGQHSVISISIELHNKASHSSQSLNGNEVFFRGDRLLHGRRGCLYLKYAVLGKCGF